MILFTILCNSILWNTNMEFNRQFTITLTNGDKYFVFTLADDKSTVTLVEKYSSSSEGMIPDNTSFAKK